MKLAKRYFGLFPISGRVGPVAYKLVIPENARIHDVFHVSLLKKHHGPAPSGSPTLPSDFVGSRPLIQPVAVLDKRTILVRNQTIPQVLVQWSDLPVEAATWEAVADMMVDFPSFPLEDKGFFKDGGNDTEIIHEQPRRRSARARNLPNRYKC